MSILFTYICIQILKYILMRIKELIKEKGYTQKDFAEKLGMTTVGLSQIVSGKPSMTTLEKIAVALNVNVWELLVSKAEIIGDNTIGNTITCPKCGTSLELKIKE